MVERRLEQAAEESTRVSGNNDQSFNCHSRSRGNVLHKPLDSSFRWNDGGGYGCSPAIFNVIFVPYVIYAA